MDLTTPRLFRWDAIPTEDVTPLLSRKVITGDKVMIAQIWLKKGCVVPLHSHEAEQLSTTFQGGLKFIINGETQVAGPGSTLVIPSWVKHEAVALEDTYELDAFSPIRHDWLNRTDGYFSNTPTQPADFSNPASASNPARLVSWDETETETISPAIDRRYLSGERVTMGDFLLRAGSVVPTHQHDSEQISWVRTGRVILTVGDERFEVVAGSVLRIPSGLPHSAATVEEAQVYDFFSPIRADWVAKTDHYLRQGSR